MTSSASEHPFEILCKLEARALRTPRVLPGLSATAASLRGVGVRIGETCLTVEDAHVREVAPIPALTRIPRCKPWLLGVGNLHGSALAVIDLPRLLGGAASERRSPTHMLVVERGAVVVGVVVDQIIGLKHFRVADRVSGMAMTPLWLQPYVHAWFLGENDEWGELDVQAVLSLPDLLNARKSGAPTREAYGVQAS